MLKKMQEVYLGSALAPGEQDTTQASNYLGNWDASTNTPTLVNGVGSAGSFYIVTVAGTADFGAGPITFEENDWVVYTGDAWIVNKAEGSLINDETIDTQLTWSSHKINAEIQGFLDDNFISTKTTWSSSKIQKAIETGTSADVFVYKGEVDELPETAVLGQVYKLTTTGLAYWWDGTKFEEFKQDLSAYYTKTETDNLLDTKVDKVAGKGLSTEDFTTDEKTKLAGIETGAEVNKIEKILLNGVEQTPDTQREVALTVITRLVDDLANYYKKTETYTKDEVNTLIGNIETLKLIKVETLPVTDIDTSAIYLLPSDDPQQQNVYTEYMYIDNAWEIIGSTAIDLSDYVTIDYLNGVLAGYIASLDSSVSNLQIMTREEFNALTQAQKDALPNGTIIFNSSEATPNITNIVDVVESGNMNPVSSNAVATVTNFNWLIGKKINFLGDGITKGHINDETAMDRPYPKNVATLLNCVCNNYSVSGSTLVDSSAPYSYQSFIDRMVDMDKTANVNVVMGGTNDFSNSQILLGNFSDTGSSTIYGALKTIAEYLIENFPNAINIFCAPIRTGSQNNGRYAMEELVYAVKSVAKSYGFVFIDTYHNLPCWIPQNTTLLARYGVNGTDTTHPNQLFSDTIFGKYIAESILRLDGGNSLTPKDAPFVRRILLFQNYTDSPWGGQLLGYVEDNILHIWFLSMVNSAVGNGVFNDASKGWNDNEYKLKIPRRNYTGGYKLITTLDANIVAVTYFGNNTNKWYWQGVATYTAGSTPITQTGLDIPLDR